MQHLLKKKFFPYVIKPGRYTGGELGQIVKSPENRFKIALGYPDKYEIGMSNIGLQIIYNIINTDDRFLCERFFAPDRDAEEILRRENIPLFSLESFRPLDQFDMIGFSLAYEMVYTNVLNILDLSGIPLKTSDRTDQHPIIAAGGPVVHNPEPMAAFFDFFCIGEIEDNIIEILETLDNTKHLPRRERLEQLVKKSPSVYVPQFYDAKSHKPLFNFAPEKIRSSKTKILKRENYPKRQIVPFIETVHDRLTIEIMRGCPRGCRFCQAVSIYKPIRIRSSLDITEQIYDQLAQTGYDEVSLLSLSSSDYPDIVPLMMQLSQNLQKQKVALALPSLRPGTFTPELAEAVKTTRKTGLTFAPEAGTERLREIIRKDITANELYDTIHLVFEKGWNLVKLYFMIGLPSETDEDIEGIVQMIRNVAEIGRKIKGKNIINVTISPFSPKAHTPFQWDRQASPEEIKQKNEYIKRKTNSFRVNIKLRDPELAFLEGLFGRGGRELSKVIETAFKSGARFDGWTEDFDFKLWRRAFEENQLNPYDYLTGRSFIAELPWLHIELKQSVEYLINERNRASAALEESIGEAISKNRSFSSQDIENNAFGRSRKKAAGRTVAIPIQNRVRIRWGKKGLIRYLSHLDNARVFERAIRRCGLPVEYSQGFHPHIKISFGPPLQLGYTSEAEYFDLVLDKPFIPSMADKLNETLPDGYFIIEARSIIGKKISLTSKLNRAVYEVSVENNPNYSKKITELLSHSKVEIKRAVKEETKVVDIRPAIFILDYRGSDTDESEMAKIYMELGVGNAGYARPSEVLLAAGISDETTTVALDIHRKDLLYIDDNGKRLTPMEF
jgi:radical SAM family uncharacterized protein/radical SAM-linked protein